MTKREGEIRRERFADSLPKCLCPVDMGPDQSQMLKTPFKFSTRVTDPSTLR